MAIPPISDPLAARLSSLPGDLFAVVDGAAFDDLQGVLTRAGLDFRPLYLDEAKESGTLAAGPHLVPCPTNFHIEQLREACGDEGIVWWAWPKGAGSGDEIFRHLRGIGMVEIPYDRPDAPRRDNSKISGKTPTEFEAVLMRHAAPDILARLLPKLDLAQRARFFGRADAVVLDFGPNKDPLYAPRPNGEPDTNKTLMRISATQYNDLAQEKRVQSRQEQIGFLRSVAPEYCDAMNADELNKLCETSNAVGKKLGLTTPVAFGYWALIALLTEANSLTNPDVLNSIRDAEDPDAEVEALMDDLSEDE